MTPFKIAWIRAGASVLAAWSLGCDAATENLPKPQAPPLAHPNVLLVSIDTLRADHCSAYGYPRPTTPHLDALARAGTLFETAYTPTPTTLPAHAALFTSHFPTELGVIKNGLALPEDATTLAEILRSAGYDTAAFVSSFVLDEQFGINQGFDVYNANFKSDEGNLQDSYEWDGRKMDRPFDRHAAATTAAALDWLGSRSGKAPFFLWVHYFDPHQPQWPQEPYRSQFARQGVETEPERVVDLYDAEVRYTDEHLGRLLDAVEAVAPGGETLSVLVGDHGEGLWQHGWLEHGANLFEEATRVPFVWRWPGRIAVGKRISAPASLLDVLPTLVSLLGLPAPPRPSRGRDLAGVVMGSASPDEERPIFMKRRHYEPQMLGLQRVNGAALAVRWKQWKLIDARLERGIALYDLERDPGELNDVAGWRPFITEALVKRLAAWQESLKGPPERSSVLPEGVRKGLEALGYVE